MKNSDFATNLKIAMRNKDEYHTDNGKKKRTKRYTMQKLADDIGYSINTVNEWTKSNGSMPNFETMKEIAKVLKVDVAYLIGEQVCQRSSDETIYNVTELNEKSAKVLTELNGIDAVAMNELLNHKQFGNLITKIFGYTHSHNFKVSITNTLDGSEMPSYSEREAMKYIVSDAFGKILDDIYEAHQQDAIDAKIGSILAKMKNDIAPYIQYKDEDKIRQNLLKIISYYQNEIKELCPDLLICKITPEHIIDNYETLKENL